MSTVPEPLEGSLAGESTYSTRAGGGLPTEGVALDETTITVAGGDWSGRGGGGGVGMLLLEGVVATGGAEDGIAGSEGIEDDETAEGVSVVLPVSCWWWWW